MSALKTNPDNWQAKTKNNTIRLAFWTGAWLVTMAIATFGSSLVWKGNNLLTLIAILTNVAVGLGMIWANKRHLQGLDEMQQKIQLEAMALALGIGLVVGLAYSTMDVTNLVPFDAEISHLVILLGLVYLTGVAAGIRRYR